MKVLSTLIVMSFLSLTLSAAEINPKASTFQWTGTKITGAHTGKIFVKSGSITEEKGTIKNGEIIMDLNTFTVDDIEGEWATKLLTHLKSEDFFTVSKYPTAKLVIKKSVGNKLEGDLTIKGKTNPVVIDYTKAGNTYAGSLKFDRTKFDMVYNSGNFFKNIGDKAIHDEVKLDFIVVTK